MRYNNKYKCIIKTNNVKKIRKNSLSKLKNIV
jgi:hypothetical protein